MLGADIDPDVRIQGLTRTEKSLVAIARALAAEAEILVLDEPTASLPADEVARLFAALRRLRARGVGMIYVSHRLDEVFEIADRMVVLRDGRVAGERGVTETTPEETILLIVGREPSQVFRRPAQREGDRAAACSKVMRSRRVGPVDCAIHSGEVVGLVGLRGAGQESIGRALFGAARRSPAAASLLDGDAARRRLAARRRWPPASISSAPTASANRSCRTSRVRENLFLNPRRRGLGPFSLLAPGRESRARRASSAEQVGLRPNDPSLPIELLSGGNQQKVVVGRWLHLASKVYVFEDPTAGVDVGAKAEIYRLFDVALQAGRRDRHHLDRFRGGRKGLPPRAGVRPRPRRGRARRRRSVGRESACRGLRQHRTHGA